MSHKLLYLYESSVVGLGGIWRGKCSCGEEINCISEEIGQILFKKHLAAVEIELSRLLGVLNWIKSYKFFVDRGYTEAQARHCADFCNRADGNLFNVLKEFPR